MRRRNSRATIALDTAKAITHDPQLRSAAAQAAPPLARIGAGVGRRLARRRAQRRVRQLNDAITTARALIATYGPLAVEQLQQIGVVEPPPKPRRTRRLLAPRFVAGALAGAGAMYLLEPSHGHEHRRQLQKLVSH